MRIERVPERAFLGAVFGLGLAVRLAFLGVWLRFDLVRLLPHDSYPMMARFWLGEIPDALTITHPPLFPAFLAFCFWAFGGARDLLTPAVLCALSAATPLLLYLWARRLEREAAARWAALWLAFDPLCVLFAPQYQSETFFLFLLFWFFAELYRCFDEPGLARFAGAGLLAGLASLSRGTLLACYPFLMLGIAARRRWVMIAAVSALWAAPILAWTARNYAYYGAFIPISVQGGWNMYEGFTLDRQELKRRPLEMGAEAGRLGLSDPIERDRHFQKKTKNFIRAHPAEAAKIVVFKALRFWRPWPYDPYPMWARIVMGIYLGALLVLAARGAFLMRADWLELLPVYLMFLALTILHSLFFTSLRYRMPIHPFLGYLAAVALVDAFRRRGKACT